jgi:NTE family protein
VTEHIPQQNEIPEHFLNEYMAFDPSIADEHDENPSNNLHLPAYRTRIVLTDGGVYDNLGIETAWKRFKYLLVSDGGARIDCEPYPAHDLLFQGIRVTNTIDAQVRTLRKRQLINSLRKELPEGPDKRIGVYWSMRSKYTAKPDAQPLDPHKLAMSEELIGQLAHLPTRLAALDQTNIQDLVNWGYAKADAVVRAYPEGVIEKTQVPNWGAPQFPFNRPYKK